MKTDKSKMTRTVVWSPETTVAVFDNLFKGTNNTAFAKWTTFTYERPLDSKLDLSPIIVEWQCVSQQDAGIKGTACRTYETLEELKLQMAIEHPEVAEVFVNREEDLSKLMSFPSSAFYEGEFDKTFKKVKLEELS